MSTDSLSSEKQLECLNEGLESISQLRVAGILAKVCEKYGLHQLYKINIIIYILNGN